MRGKRHRAIKRTDDAVGRQARCQAGFDPADFAFAGKENKDAAGGFGQRLHDEIGRGLLGSSRLWRCGVEVAQIDRKGAPLRSDHRGVVKQCRDRVGVERGGHHEDDEIGAQGGAHFPCQGQAKVGVQAAFVEFVKDQRADAGQVGVRLQHPGQDAFGHDLDIPARHRIAAHPVADRLAGAFADLFGKTFGGRAGGKAAWFQHHDLAARQPGIAHCQRHPRRLARAGRGLQHGAAMRLQGGDEGGQGGVDRQGHGRVMPGRDVG